MSAIDGDTEIKFLIGTLPDGRIVLDFRRMVDHLKLDPRTACDMAEGLVEAVRQAAAGRHIITGTKLNPERT